MKIEASVKGSPVQAEKHVEGGLSHSPTHTGRNLPVSILFLNGQILVKSLIHNPRYFHLKFDAKQDLFQGMVTKTLRTFDNHHSAPLVFST